ncbi:MAG: bacillithiol biosynthesis cysteine-adding enzyme BshC [Bacteroidota bacterium]
MQTEKIPLEDTDCFSRFFIDYLSQKPELSPFYRDFPGLQNFEQTIKERKFDDENRIVLNRVLSKQYEALDASTLVKTNIERLKDTKTFTITTGHQLNIFTGPLYFLYKIITVINACKVLKQTYPEYEFIPVYWMASEDHDFEEINHFYFRDKKYEWHSDQTGAVGRFNPNGLAELAKSLPKSADFFKEAYQKTNLAEAVRSYVNHLFGEEGLVVIDADDKELKQRFSPVIKSDLLAHTPFQLVPGDSEKIEALGYKTQINCREINFFYLDGTIRERIETEGEGFRVLNTDLTFTVSEMEQLITDHPECFSPNVILRPLYQETILPNLAYVGGPSEVVYWLQLKSVFEHFNTAFPLLMPRNFATIVSETARTKWEKTELTYTDLFHDVDAIFTKWVKTHSSNDLSLQKEVDQIKHVYSDLEEKMEKVDPTLRQHIEALYAKAEKSVFNAEKKLVRAEKRKQREKHGQIEQVKNVLFPGGTLQERRDNFLNFHERDPEFIQKLLDTFDPFDYQMYLLFPE